jgi:paired amphipathic helix protein Sin3a
LSELLVKFKEVCLEFPDWEERYSESVEKTEYYGFISAMGILNCRQVTPSYRALPDEVVKLPCSGRNQIGDENLNDSMFSLPTGNEGGEEDREKHFVKNQYEEALFRVEDERFELDRIIEANADVLLTLKRVQDDLNLLPFEDLSRYPIESKFNQVQLKAVARLYGDQWYEVMVQLKENPGRTVPIIISRAEQKGKEWDHVKSQLKNSWRSIFQENFYKALDYRSLSFKSEEKKKLNPKHLISELKNAIQKKQSQSSFSAGDSDSHSTVKPAPPCFVYSFSDEEVHQQVYSLILLSANRTYNYPAVSKMLKFCKTFLRHFLNLESTTFVVPSDVDMALDNSDDDKSAIGEDDSDAKNAEDANRMELNDEELPITSGEVKPVRVMLETWSFQEKFNPVRRHTRSSTLFFGNYNFYVFFRLYQMLYSRIFECKKLCQEKDTGDYSLLIKEIHQFVCEKIDSLTFEEDLRTLYGAGSYLLFTIDKLMAQLIKHVCFICYRILQSAYFFFSCMV